MKLECVNDECFSDFVKMGKICDNAENLTLT